MNKDQMEVSNAEVSTNVSPDDVNEGIASEKAKRTPMDSIVALMADTVAATIRQNDQKKVKGEVNAVLRTVMAINSLDEYQLGLRVGGELYRFDEYRVSPGLQGLIVAKRVTVTDESADINLLKVDPYAVSGNILDPGSFYMCERDIFRACRVNPETKPLSRPEVSLLAEVAKYVVNGRKVINREQKQLVYLSFKISDQPDMPIEQWAQKCALSLFV